MVLELRRTARRNLGPVRLPPLEHDMGRLVDLFRGTIVQFDNKSNGVFVQYIMPTSHPVNKLLKEAMQNPDNR